MTFNKLNDYRIVKRNDMPLPVNLIQLSQEICISNVFH